ncbi:MAG: hypothetical protein KDC12_06810 [Flavobacteriales bacterium]|nr:hypothetical protein [Flavobacteriales bacterium]
MKYSEFKNVLATLDQLTILEPNGTPVAPHFHVTEVGHIQKRFIDCGGTMRTNDSISFQLYLASDVDHRLSPQKLEGILRKSERHIHLGDHEIEVEYQGATIGKYGLSFNGSAFVLQAQHTDCLAKDHCGIPVETAATPLEAAPASSGCCSPGSGCC